MIAMLLALGLLVAVPQANTDTATGAVAGTVREDGTRAPVPNARVTVIGPRLRQTAIADAQGQFAIAGLAPGRYNIVAEMDGFAFDLVSPPAVTLAAGRRTTVTLDLRRAAVVTGEVRDENGDPRGGVSVTAIRKTANGGTEMSARTAGVANELGAFRIEGLLPGEYLVLASPPVARARGSAVMPTYYPSVTEQRSATSIALQSGQALAGVVITMQTIPAHEITGTVVDGQGRPVRALIAFVSQSIQTWDPNQSSGLRVNVTAVASQADGTFRIRGLGPGSYRLTPVPALATVPQQLPPEVMAAGLMGNRATKQVDVHDQDVSGVTLVLGATGR